MATRAERWIKDGRYALVDVNSEDETVLCSYELFASLLTQLGFTEMDEVDGCTQA